MVCRLFQYSSQNHVAQISFLSTKTGKMPENNLLNSPNKPDNLSQLCTCKAISFSKYKAQIKHIEIHHQNYIGKKVPRFRVLLDCLFLLVIKAESSISVDACNDIRCCNNGSCWCIDGHCCFSAVCSVGHLEWPHRSCVCVTINV